MDVIMPQLGETVLEGTVSIWYKKPGDAVTADEPLFEVETEKVTTEIPASATGVLSAIHVEPGVSVKVGTRLAVIDVQNAVAELQSAAVRATAIQHVSPPGTSSAPTAGMPARQQRARLSPLVRRLLKENQLNSADVSGTGKLARVTPADVLAHARAAGAGRSAPTEATTGADSAVRANVTQPATRSAPGGSGDQYVVPLSRIRRLTAAHMVRSKATSPHALQAVEVDFHAVEAARQRFGQEWRAREGFSLTYLPFIARAVCGAIARYPNVNASFGADELIVHTRMHLGIAVDMNFEGLAIAVLRDAQNLALRRIATDLQRLSDTARRGTLSIDEAGGSTYTISNNGSFGTYFSAPIINQPQVAILSTDSVRKKPVVIENTAGDFIAIRPIGVLAQSFDHRAIDGAYSAAFLRCLREIIENTNWIAELA
jgi:2-oxoglutarate dehydrogenase E2 component (dihydrolipoamide succinyltransferase)